MADAAPAVEPAADPPKRARRLSLVGTEHEGQDVSAVRRASIMADETEKAVDAAPAAEKAQILIDTVKADIEKPEGPEFASWALSCANQLIQADSTEVVNDGAINEEGTAARANPNRSLFVSSDFITYLIKYLETHESDVFVQYQGIQTLQNLAGFEGAADKFGTVSMQLLVKAICGTDMVEVLEPAISGLRTLVAQSDACAKYESKDLVYALEQLTNEEGDLKDLNRFKFTSSELIKEIKEKNPDAFKVEEKAEAEAEAAA